VLLVISFFLASFQTVALGEVPTFIGVSHAGESLAGLNYSDIKGHWARIPILNMTSMGIMKGAGGKFNPNTSISRQEIVTTLVRFLGRDEDAEKINLYKPKNTAFRNTGFYASTWAYGYLEVARQEGIISTEEAKTLDWSKPAERQEAALLLCRALGLSPLFGSDQQVLAPFKDADQIGEDFRPYVAAAVKKGFMSGSNGLLRPLSPLSRAEAASIMDRVKQDFPFGISFRSGEIISIYTYGVRENGIIGEKTVYELLEADGQRYNLESSNLVVNGWEDSRRDFIVSKNGVYGLSDSLRKGDHIKYAISQGQVLFAEVIPQYSSTVAGEISFISTDGKSIYVVDDMGDATIISLSEAVNVMVDERPARIIDLVEGQQITATIVNGTVRSITAYSGREPGYVPPQSLIIEGTISEITKDGENYKVTLESYEGNLQKFIISPFTILTRGSSRINTQELRLGERIVAYFSSSNLEIADRIAASPKGAAAGFLKARLAGSILTQELLLEDVSSFFYGSWVKNTAAIKIPIAQDAQVYMDGKALDIKDIQNYRGAYAYIGLSKDFGQDEAEKIVIKSGDEYLANGIIDEILWSKNFIEVGGIETLFGNDAIIGTGKDFTGIQSIDEDGQAFVVTNKNNDLNRAVIIFQPEFYNPYITIWKGYIDEITRRGLEIDRYRLLEYNNWTKVKSSSKEFDVADDAYIIDASDKTARVISPEEFSQDRFDQNYYDYYAYILSNDERAFAIILLEEDPESENISLGRILQKTRDGWMKMSLKDYSPFRESWNSSLNDLEVDLSHALIVKKGEIVDVKDLKLSDTLYLIRDNNVAILGFVLD